MTLFLGWLKKPFIAVTSRHQTKSGKLKTTNYQNAGCLPIIDQGEKLIAGFTDDYQTKYQGPYPVIVFGDHTKNVKLLNIEFAVGGDGVVLLYPKNERELNITFLYFWLKYIPLHNLGYSRYFKVLKEQNICFPKDINEQLRIVSLIEELTHRADEARSLILEKETEFDILIRATYQRMIEDAEWKPLKQVASLVRRKINTQSDEEYEEMGIRSFGKGTFKKPVLTGEQIGNKRIYRVHEGDLVFNNVFAWEGAIAVAQPEDHGRVGSHRFVTYSPHKGKATAEFLCHHFLSEQGLEAIGAASPGSAGRNRTLGLTKLDKIKVPVPAYQEQIRFEKLAKRRRLIQCESSAVVQELATFQAAVIAKAFRGEL